MRELLDLRVRSRLKKERLNDMVGKVLTDDDYDILMTGPTRVTLPSGAPLCIYLPGALNQATLDASYDTLHSLRQEGLTPNRWLASGFRPTPSKLGKLPTGNIGRTRSNSVAVSSAIVGSAERNLGGYPYCRLTAWTGRELDKFEGLFPLFREIGDKFAEYVPDRHAAQMKYVRSSRPEWVIRGTPFSTITVNNSYPTGMHTDKGDLDEGFSNLSVLTRGQWHGGTFVFPEYRVAVNMKESDLLLMDAHQWHGNTMMTCDTCGDPMKPRFLPDGGRTQGWHEKCGSERISIVAYFRSAITECGSVSEEFERATEVAEKGTQRGKRYS